MTEFTIIAAFFAIAGIVLFVLIGRRPEFFWPSLITLPLIFSGFMVVGRAVVDEYLLIMVLAGGLLAVWRGLVPRGGTKKTSLHWWIFLFTVVYFFLQSLRGLITFEDVKTIRWMVYFVSFIVLTILARNWKFPMPRAFKTAKMIGVSSSFYFGAYLVLGLINECALGNFRWHSQGMLWAGSSYAVFPVVVSLPAAAFLLKSGNKKIRYLGWLTIFLSIAAVGFYESRFGWFVAFGIIVFMPFIIGRKKTLKLLPGFILLLGFIIFLTLSPISAPYWWDGHNVISLDKPYCNTLIKGEAGFSESLDRFTDANWYGARAGVFLEGIYTTALTPINPRYSDLDRSLHFKAGFAAFSENSLNTLLGGGVNSHRVLLRPHLEKFYQIELPDLKVSPVVRTVGLSAVLVDTGLLGLFLIILNIFFVATGVFSNRDKIVLRESFPILISLLFVLLWFLVINLQDIVIYFLLISPFSFFTLLVRD